MSRATTLIAVIALALCSACSGKLSKDEAVRLIADREAKTPGKCTVDVGLKRLDAAEIQMRTFKADSEKACVDALVAAGALSELKCKE